MQLDPWITTAREQGASDLHLEPGLPMALRIRGALRTAGEPLPGQTLLETARALVPPEGWSQFVERRSFDLSRTIAGVRCRINLFHTARGVGFAIRLLSSFQATLGALNLHPDLRRFVAPHHGLVVISGPTGCGKSTSLAALIQEINLTEPRHIITIESPIEYTFRPRQAYIRQREVGRDTPSFEQALLDALREDPDVLMVGEMRDPETMRLTLSAAETGHLVFGTLHSSTCAEALQRIASAFPAEIQSAVRAQLADCLVGVMCQRLRYKPDLKIRIPECELLFSSTAVKSFIRSGDFFKIASAIETGAEHGMWTWQRYQGWLDRKKDWHIPSPDEQPEGDLPDAAPPPPLAKPAAASRSPARPAAAPSAAAPAGVSPAKPVEIEPAEGGLEAVLRKLREK
ncbi:MAG: PilT/PilU family type 4a pilus ATPase [Verrucomicrobia bacterium]|nr:PilT/PilU family type 4a pilus ATPase [Verrucomicrobiota bacterium]